MDDGYGAGDGNRTHVASLEGWGFATKLRPLAGSIIPRRRRGVIPFDSRRPICYPMRKHHRSDRTTLCQRRHKVAANKPATQTKPTASEPTPEQLKAALKLVLATHAPAYRELANL